MRTLCSYSTVALLLATSADLALAQGKKGGGGGAAATATPAAAPAPSSSAAIEAQMLAFGALDKIAAAIATQVCPLIPNPPAAPTPPNPANPGPSPNTVVIYGFFLQVVQQRKVNGPILVTHSDKDEAVGIAYPLASRISRDTAARLGDANDIFGGIGRNGAQHMGYQAQFLTLLGGRPDYSLAADKVIYNFNRDEVITSHGDVARPETAWLLAKRILA
jgi:hypothetical protein